MILDATAGNRTMWHDSPPEDTIFIDIEKKLEIKPTIFADNTNTPFFDKQFDTIFYDPPHMFGDKGSFYVYPDAKSFKERWKGYGEIPRYYGGDKYKTGQELILHIYKAQKEFHRILKDDGLLWLKWNETEMPLRRILQLFDMWKELLILPIKAPSQTAGTKQTFWVCMYKEKREYVQTTLL
jgi:DNA modification methylase